MVLRFEEARLSPITSHEVPAVLLVEGDPWIRQRLHGLLGTKHWILHEATTLRSARAILATEAVDLLLVGDETAGPDGLADLTRTHAGRLPDVVWLHGSDVSPSNHPSVRAALCRPIDAGALMLTLEELLDDPTPPATARTTEGGRFPTPTEAHMAHMVAALDRVARATLTDRVRTLDRVLEGIDGPTPVGPSFQACHALASEIRGIATAHGHESVAAEAATLAEMLGQSAAVNEARLESSVADAMAAVAAAVDGLSVESRLA